MSNNNETENELDAAIAEASAREAPAPVGQAVGQMGVLRYVQLTYFGLWVALAWLLIKVGGAIWERLYESFDKVPEPDANALAIGCGIVGLATIVALYRSATVNGFVNDVCIELTKVTWPTRKETWNQTVVVLIVSTIASVILGTFDVLWSGITDLIYGT